MQTSARAIRGHALASNTEAKRILLVEDDTDLAMLLRDYLESYFYRVTTVANGVDGLKARNEFLYLLQVLVDRGLREIIKLGVPSFIPEEGGI